MKKAAFLMVCLVLIASVGFFYLGRQTAPEQPQSEVTQIVDTAHGEPGNGEEGIMEDAESLLEEDVTIISESAMLRFFESAFEHGVLIREITKTQDTLQIELEDLATFETDTSKFKEGYQDEYVIWRANKLASTEELPEISSNKEVSEGDVEDKAPSSGTNGQTTEKAPEKKPEKAPSGGNTNSNTGGNSGSTNNSGSTGSAGPNSPMSSEWIPPEVSKEYIESIEQHIKNEGITIGGCGD